MKRLIVFRHGPYIEDTGYPLSISDERLAMIKSFLEQFTEGENVRVLSSPLYRATFLARKIGEMLGKGFTAYSLLNSIDITDEQIDISLYDVLGVLESFENVDVFVLVTHVNLIARLPRVLSKRWGKEYDLLARDFQFNLPPADFVLVEETETVKQIMCISTEPLTRR